MNEIEKLMRGMQDSRIIAYEVDFLDPEKKAKPKVLQLNPGVDVKRDKVDIEKLSEQITNSYYERKSRENWKNGIIKGKILGMPRNES